MMITELNLLPPHKRVRLRYLIKFLFSKGILEVVTLVCCVLASSLIWSWVVLQDSFAQLAVSAAAVDREFSSYNKDTKNINKTIRSVNSASKDFAPALPKLLDIVNSLPADIRLNMYRLDRKSGQLTLNGEAKTRAALLNYQEVLANIPWIKNVQTPVSQLFQKENISFEIKAEASLPRPPGAPKPKVQQTTGEDDL